MTKIGPVLKGLMRDQSLSETALARLSGVSQPVVHRLMTEQTPNPRLETVRALAQCFHISIHQLIGEAPLPSHMATAASSSTWKNIPLLSLKEACLWADSRHQHQINASKNKIGIDLPVSDHSYAIHMPDTTMSPRFPEGTVLIIDPQQTAQNQDFVLAQYKVGAQSQTTFKQLLIDGEKRYLKPLNPDFQVIQMTDQYSLLGTLIQARTDYRV